MTAYTFSWGVGDDPPPYVDPSGTGRLNIGGGGLLQSVRVTRSDGTKVCWADTYGGFIWDDDLDKWVDVCLPSYGIAKGSFSPDTNCFGLAVAETDTNRIYGCIWDGSINAWRIMRSSDRCATDWVIPANGYSWTGISAGNRNQGPHLTVDPFNKDVIAFGAPWVAGPGGGTAGANYGVWISRDAGDTIARCSDVTAPAGDASQSNGCIVEFDASGGTTTVGGLTVCKNLYAHSYGTGFFKSVDGGVTWTQVSSSVQNISQMDIIQSGTYAGAVWMTSNYLGLHGGSAQGVWRYYSGTLSEIPIPNGFEAGAKLPYEAIACCQITARSGEVLFLGRGNGALQLAMTKDNGATVAVDSLGIAITSAFYYDINMLAPSPEPGYLQYIVNTGVGGSFFITNACHDKVADRYYTVGAQSCWWTTLDSSTFPTLSQTINWTSLARGIEGDYVCDFLHPPSSPYPVVIAVQDQGVTINGDGNTFAPDYWLRSTLLNSENLGYAIDDPSVVAMFCSLSRGGPGKFAVSDNWGVPDSFTLMTDPPNTVGACGGDVSTTLNMMFYGTGNETHAHVPQYTTDGGVTWHDSDLPTSPMAVSASYSPDPNYWSQNLDSNMHLIAADKVTANTWYAIARNEGTTPTGAGIYKSTNSGQNFTLKSTAHNNVLSNGSIYMRAVPGHAGHVFIAPVSGATGSYHLICTDQGFDVGHIFTISAATIGLLGAAQFGFGAVAPGASYPRLWVRNVSLGVSYCDDANLIFSSGTPTFTVATADWQVLFDFDHFPRGINGDECDYSKCYLGTNGYGAWQIVVP